MTSKQCCKFRNSMHTGNKISSFHQRHNFHNLKSDLFLVTFTRERLEPVQSYNYTGYISVQFLFLVTVMHNRWRLAASTIVLENIALQSVALKPCGTALQSVALKPCGTREPLATAITL